MKNFLFVSVAFLCISLSLNAQNHDRAMSVGDPNIVTPWNWMDPNPVTLYHVQNGRTFSPKLPYYEDEGAAGRHIAPQDVSPDDGWELLFKDFGVPGNGTSLPRFALYNKFKGVMRVFIFPVDVPEAFTAAFVKMSLIGSSTIPPLLTFYADETLQDYDPSRTVAAATPIVSAQWSYVDYFVTGYVSDITAEKYRNAKFQFELWGVDETTLTLAGNITLSAKYAGGSSSNMFTNVSEILTSFDGEKVANFIEILGRDSADRANIKKANAENKTNTKNKLINLLSMSFSQYIPLVGQVAGFLGSFIGGGTSPRLSRLEGPITLDGKMVQYNYLGDFRIRVPLAPASDNVSAALYTHKMGLFNLVERARVKYNPGGTQWSCNGYTMIYCGPSAMQLKNPLNYIINNDIPGGSIMSVEGSFVNTGDPIESQTEFVPMNIFNSMNTIKTSVSKVAIRLTMNHNAPVSGFVPVNVFKTWTPICLPEIPVSVSMSGPTIVTSGTSATWTANVTDYPAPVGRFYQWKIGSTVVGTASSYTGTFTSNFTLTLNIFHHCAAQYPWVQPASASVVKTVSVESGGGGGCPYIFASTEQGLVADNDILHRTMLKENMGRNITDMYTLKNKPFEMDGEYKLQIREMAQDHSYLDAFRLYAVDHDPQYTLGTTEANEIVLYNTADIRYASNIYTENGFQQYKSGDQFKWQKDDVMHISFSGDPIMRKSGERLALLIDFNVKVRSLPPGKGGGGEVVVRRDNNESLSKQVAGLQKFGVRQQGNVAIVPIYDEMDLSDIMINWASDYEIQSIGVVPVSEAVTKTQLSLKTAVHSKSGDVISKLVNTDTRYSELLPEEYIDLTFESVALKEGLSRDFAFETNGHYFMPKDKEYESANTIPNDFYLGDSYPNPFNPGTTIQYGLSKDADVTLKIYNALGQEIRTLVSSRQPAGVKSIYWDGKNNAGATVASGIYIYRIQAGKFTQSKKMMLIK